MVLDIGRVDTACGGRITSGRLLALSYSQEKATVCPIRAVGGRMDVPAAVPEKLMV